MAVTGKQLFFHEGNLQSYVQEIHTLVRDLNTTV